MRQALEMALEALELHGQQYPHMVKGYCLDAITAIKEALAQPEEEKLHPVHIGVDVTKEGTAVTAFYRRPNSVMEMFYSQFHPLAQPEQEPVACVGPWHDGRLTLISRYSHQTFERDQPLYTTPPQRKPLTDEQIQKCYETTGHYQTLRPQDKFAVFALARAIEAAHGIKE